MSLTARATGVSSAKSAPVLSPAEAREIRQALDLSPLELSSLLGVTERTVLDREAGRQPVNLQAALAMEFVRIANESEPLRNRLSELVTKATHPDLPS